MNNNQPTVFITGCSSGFGYLAVKKFLINNWNVIATMRDISKAKEFENCNNILILKMDVTNQTEVEFAAKAAVEKFGKIDVLINNAGFGALGLFECASQEEIMHEVNVNILGVINTTQAILPYMRSAQKGRIINISSIAGRIGFKGLSIYNMSKFAIEGLSEALRAELDEFNIKVQLIEPGAFKTGFGKATNINKGRNPANMEQNIKDYENYISKNIDKMSHPFKYGNPQDVADLMFTCASGNKNSFRNPIGKDAKMMLFLKKLIPDYLLFKILNLGIKLNK